MVSVFSPIKSTHNSFIKLVHKSSNISSIYKPSPVVVCKCFVYNYSPSSRKECVQVYVKIFCSTCASKLDI